MQINQAKKEMRQAKELNIVKKKRKRLFAIGWVSITKRDHIELFAMGIFEGGIEGTSTLRKSLRTVTEVLIDSNIDFFLIITRIWFR